MIYFQRKKPLLLVLLLAVRRELATLNNQQVTIDLEEKSGQWLGGTVHSTGTNGKAMVQLHFFLPVFVMNLMKLYSHDIAHAC